MKSHYSRLDDARVVNGMEVDLTGKGRCSVERSWNEFRPRPGVVKQTFCEPHLPSLSQTHGARHGGYGLYVGISPVS